MHAVVLLGSENVARWATLTIFAEIGDKPRELLLTALIRARFCQRAGEAHDGPPAQRFTLGLFSVIDALTDTPMQTALKHLPFPRQMCDALIDHSGPGRLLDCVQAIEHGDFQKASHLLQHPARHYLESLAWTNDTAKHLFGLTMPSLCDGALRDRRIGRGACLPGAFDSGTSLSGLDLVAACGLGDLAGRRELGEGGADRRAAESGSCRDLTGRHRAAVL